MNQYSVLMSVYYKEKPENLRIAMDSMWNQTVPTDDFVLVCDGPLTPELDAVIEDIGKYHTELRVVRLEKNVGLGNALNVGMNFCRNELVARMDSDDISHADRCEQQLYVFQSRPEVAVVSAAVEEFISSPDIIESQRCLPETQDEIIRFAKRRNPFNHSCVMYKRTAVEASGGYQEFYLLEDYYLWVRMLQGGFQGYNIQNPLLWMRAGSEMYSRRGGWNYAKSQCALFAYMKRSGFIDTRQFMMSTTIRVLSSVLPTQLREIAFRFWLRK